MTFPDFFASLTTILPLPPVETPAEIAQTGIDFFGLWIARIGGIVAFIGAIKFALSVKSDDARDQLNAVLIMVSGFMIRSAVRNLGIFSLTTADTDTIYTSIMTFISTWSRRVGALAAMIGAVMFGFSFKDENAATKINGLRTFAAGAICVSVSGLLTVFVT
jgi:hypothetical protein